MKIENKVTYKIVTPEEGKYLYNGEYTTTVIYAPISCTLSEWSEITEDEKNELDVSLNNENETEQF